MKMHNEKGIALPLAMIALLIGALVVPLFIGHAGTGLIGTRHYRDLLGLQYGCDAGAEHAIWNLVEGGLAELIPDSGDIYEYDLDETINGETVHVMVSNSYNVVAWDDFETNNWIGGGGWLDNWAAYGSPETTSSDSPKQGTYHVRMNNTDRITRSVDLSGGRYANLRFWYKQTNNFDGGSNADYAYLEVSNDGTTYQQVCRWTSSNNTYYSTYRYLTVPLASYGLSDTFYVRFRADTDTGENFYVDDLDIVWLAIQTEAIAEEDFESGDWTGGWGWLNNDPWTVSGRAEVNSGITIWPRWFGPHGGSHQAQLRGGGGGSSTGVIRRGVDLSAQSVVHFRFWGRQDGFGNSDRLYLQVSSTGSSGPWTTAATFGRRSQTGVQLINGTWRMYDIDLSGYSLTSNFWIRFYNNFTGSDKYVWLDDIKINSTSAYYITAITGNQVLTVCIDIVSGVESILWWRFDT
jgi:hypothetical protein